MTETGKTAPKPSLDEKKNLMPEPLDKKMRALTGLFSALFVLLCIEFLGDAPTKHPIQKDYPNSHEHRQKILAEIKLKDLRSQFPDLMQSHPLFANLPDEMNLLDALKITSTENPMQQNKPNVLFAKSNTPSNEKID